MWNEYEFEKKFERTFSEIKSDIESGKFQENKVEIVVDPDGSFIVLTIQALMRFSSAKDILKHYKDSVVEVLREHRAELELDKEDGKIPSYHLIN